MRAYGIPGSILVCLLAAGTAFGGDVGGAIDVAPNVKDTQMQLWPGAAWAAGPKAWLVVWREGYVNEEATDVYAARVSAEGKALDPAGIKICSANDRQEHIVVASDGKGWLVVWSDFRGGKDYDVYAARVSAEGEVLDPDGFLVAGGDPASPGGAVAAGHNQCWPAAAFAGGNYVVVWQAYCGSYPDRTKEKDGGVSGYRLFGTTVSPDGKVAVPGGALLTPPGMHHALRPVAVAGGDGQRVLVAFQAYAPIAGDGRNNRIGTLWVDGASGKPGEVDWQPSKQRNPDNSGTYGDPLAVAWGKGGGMVLLTGGEGPPGLSMRTFHVGDTGARAYPNAGELKMVFHACNSIASDGDRYLLTCDRGPDSKNHKGPLAVQARFAPGDWKGEGADQGLFPVAGEGGKTCMMGRAAAGPRGTFLVVYTLARGVEDFKVQARVVK